MEYLVFARKYRPQLLDEIQGQEHIVQILTNAFKSGRLAQSFLFVGSRGVGKTSTARIVAKILNCLKRKDGEAKPCNICDSCKEITEGRSLDVLEIDGASNRGIDEIRNLRENVKFKPNYGKYKVYIIDEVHMLTQEAFNALLKTLEEPPSHVKFIFATTEPHRILPTIVSRCQRFDFKRIATRTIVETLQKIAKKEKIAIDEEALFLLAKSAEGSLRDGESLLDQLSSYSQGKITIKDIEQVLGCTKEETYFSLCDALIKKDGQTALTLVQDVVRSGKDLVQFNKGLVEFLRDLLMIKEVSQPEKLVDRLKKSIAEIKTRADQLSIEELLYMFSVLQNLLNQIKYANAPQMYTEVAILKLVHRESMISIEELLNQYEAQDEGGSAQQKTASPAPAAAQVAPRTRSYAVPQKERLTKKKEQYLNPRGAHGGKKMQKNADPDEIPEGADEDMPLPVDLSVGQIETSWGTILGEVKKKRMSLGVFLSEAEPVEVDGDTIIIGFPAEFNFHKETLDALENKTLIEKTIQKVLRVRIRIKFVVTEKEASEKNIQKEEERVQHSQIVESALNIFSGKTIRKS